VLDINGTPEQLDVVVRGLQVALASRHRATELGGAPPTTPGRALHLAEKSLEPFT
jgi:hypothetical protein